MDSTDINLETAFSQIYAMTGWTPIKIVGTHRIFEGVTGLNAERAADTLALLLSMGANLDAVYVPTPGDALHRALNVDGENPKSERPTLR